MTLPIEGDNERYARLRKCVKRSRIEKAYEPIESSFYANPNETDTYTRSKSTERTGANPE